MKKSTQYLVAATILVIGILLNIVPLGAQQEQVRRPGVTKPAGEKPDTPPPPAPPAQLASSGKLVIRAAAVPGTMEASRRTSFEVSVEGGLPPYEMGTSDTDPCYAGKMGDKFVVACDPEEEGEFDLVMKATDSSKPDNLSGEIGPIKVKVTPYVATPTDNENRMNAIEANLLREIQNAIESARQNAWMTRQHVIRAKSEALIAQIRVERLQQKFNWVIYVGAPLALTLIVLMAIIAFGIIQLNREKRRTNVTRIANIVIFALVLGLGAGIASAQTPNPAGLPTTPAGTTTPATPPAAPVVEPTIASFEPSWVLPGQKNVAFTVRGTNLDQVTLAFNPEFKLRTKKDASGADVPDLRVSKDRKSISGMFTEIDPGTASGANGPGATFNGTEVSVNKASFYVVPRGLASFVQATAASAGKDVAFRHYVQAEFQRTYGDEAGNKAYNAYAKKPSHAGANMLFDAQDARVRAVATEVVTEYGAEFGKRVMERVAELQRADGKLAGRVFDLEAETNDLGTIRAGVDVAVTHTVRDEPRKVGKVLGLFGGRPNELRTLAERVAAALAERGASASNQEKEEDQ